HPNGLELSDAFYLDQRIAGWGASIEQGMDMLRGISLHPANNHSVFRALLAADPDARARKAIQKKAIEYLDKGLMTFPINPHSPLRSLRRTLGRVYRRLFE